MTRMVRGHAGCQIRGGLTYDKRHQELWLCHVADVAS